MHCVDCTAFICLIENVLIIVLTALRMYAVQVYIRPLLSLLQLQ